MLKEFQKFIVENKLIEKSDAVLIACSGGKDSMVMVDLFLKAGYKIALAHCNFQLRDKDADQDEKFVITFCKKNKIPVHTKKFDTQTYAAGHKVSIQMAARELRYNWFKKLQEDFNYNVLATAHHQSDLLETVLINLIRGTGISGLHGILPKINQIIRPLLFASREMIDHYALKNKIRWREDSSNSDDHYVRNKIRHHILPVLKEINPSVEKTFFENALRFHESELLLDSIKEIFLEKIVSLKNETVVISIDELKKVKSVNSLLYFILKEYGFANDTVEQINLSLDKQSGKKFLSATHEIILDRNRLLVLKSESKKEDEVFRIGKELSDISTKNFNLHFEIIPNTKDALTGLSNGIALLDTSKIKFPLTLRRWQHGDYFFPFGMYGKRKKLSDFFTDIKLSIPEKSDCLLLTSENNIAWVINYRIDEHFKVTGKTKHILKCVYTKL